MFDFNTFKCQLSIHLKAALYFAATLQIPTCPTCWGFSVFYAVNKLKWSLNLATETQLEAGCQYCSSKWTYGSRPTLNVSVFEKNYKNCSLFCLNNHPGRYHFAYLSWNKALFYFVIADFSCLTDFDRYAEVYNSKTFWYFLELFHNI